jgi:hypothetical protein
MMPGMMPGMMPMAPMAAATDKDGNATNPQQF